MVELNPEERYQLRKLQMDVDSRWRETHINREFGAPELVISITH